MSKSKVIGIRKPRVPVHLSRSRLPESVVSKNLLDGFVVEGSRGERLIEEITNISLDSVSRKSLAKIAFVFSKLAGIKITRNICRRKDLLVKWFQDNEEKIDGFKMFVTIPV